MNWPLSDEHRGARFQNCDMSGARFREVDLTGAQMRGVALVDVDIDGAISNVVINGVDVVPLVLAELDRRHPERIPMRSDDPDHLRKAWKAIESQWQATTERIGALPDDRRRQRVDDEWSAVETMRHLIFATDAWYGRAIRGEVSPYHPIGLAPDGMEDQDLMGLDATAAPTFDEVVAVRQERQDAVRAFLADATAERLQAHAAQVDEPGWPPPDPQRTALRAIRVILNEEWAHHRYCVRDLAVIEGA